MIGEPPEQQKPLAARGYRAADETSTLYMDFAEHAPASALGIAVELIPQAPSADWLSARMRFQGGPASERSKIEKILRQLAIPAVFAAVRGERGEAGAEGACLQVVSDNTPAVRLYQKLGFSRVLYRYHYRTLAVM